jgi:hypothetical protein
MSRERLQAPEMQALIRDAERRTATGRAGEGPTAEALLRKAREQRDLVSRSAAVPGTG